MSARTIFISAASDDLERLRNALHGAFSRAHFRVFTQGQSLGVATGTLTAMHDDLPPAPHAQLAQIAAQVTVNSLA